METTSNISVVIPTRNRARDLERCIKSLLNQTLPPYEIIVIDDDSSDNTSIICKKYSVKYIKNSKRMLQSYGKNIGIKKSNSQLVAFIDDDCVAYNTWLEELLKALKNNEKNGIVGGRIKNMSDVKIPDLKEVENNAIVKFLIRLFYLRSNKTGKWYINGEVDCNFDSFYEGEVDFVGAGNMMINKEKVNVLFDENLKRNCRHEEIDFCYRAKMNDDVKVFFTPRAVVLHNFSKTSRVDPFKDLYFMKRNLMYFTLKNGKHKIGILQFLSFIYTQLMDVFVYTILSMKNRCFFYSIFGKRDGIINYLKNKS